MIIVRVELHSAMTGIITELARMRITNTGGGTKELGDYDVVTFRGRAKDRLDKAMRLENVTRRGKVTGHARLREHVWHLVGKALSSMNYGKDESH
jgi:hypothetical protein